MSDAAQIVRPSKRDAILIDGETSINDQPAQKSVKREEVPVSPPEVIGLLQKLDTTVELSISLQRTARAEKKRADELEARLAATTRMEEARRRADSKIRLELATENEALKAELAAVGESQNNWLHTMTVERDVERKTARDSHARDRARIEELTQKLAHYESVLQPVWQLQQQPQQLQQLPATMPRPAGVARAALNIATPDGVEMKLKSGHRLANADLTEKLLDLVQQALNFNQLTSGVQAVEESINHGTSEMLILAADSKNASVRLGLPTLCEEKSVPFIFVPSASHLGRAAGFSGERRVAVAIDKLDGSGIEQQIREMKEEVEKLH